MPTAFTVPDDYRYVVAALSSTALVVWGQVITVARTRRRAKIAYPQMYADKAEVEASRDAHIFNCAQRAHQNTLENLPLIILSTAITGLQYPLSAASFCAFWSISRIPFTLGYLSGTPANRSQFGASFAFLGNMLLSCVSAYVAVKRLC